MIRLRLYCPNAECTETLLSEDIHVFAVDAADQCDDGRFEPPTYSISIVCHSCGCEIHRQDGCHAEYGAPEIKGKL